MARLLSISRGSTGHTKPTRSNRTRAFGNSIKLGPVTLTIMTVGLVGILALFFIVSTTATSAEGFELHSLEQQAKELRDENQRLEVDLSKLRSLDRLEKSIDESKLNFVPVTKVTSIRISDEALASIDR